MKRRRPLNVSDLDLGLMNDLGNIFKELETNPNDIDDLKRFMDSGRPNQLLQYWSLCGEVSINLSKEASLKILIIFSSLVSMTCFQKQQ